MPTVEPDELSVDDADGHASVVFRWTPRGSPRAVVHVLHGWGEHARRYDRLATALVEAGYAVYADDHRGHGQTGVRSGTLGDLGPRAGDGVLDAVHAVTRRAAADHEGVPLFVLGHSWGSFLLQRYLRRWSDEIDGAILTGTTYRDPAAPTAERPPLNAAFEPARTPYDWLSRDEAEVDRYIADPLCGFEIMSTTPAGAGRQARSDSTAAAAAAPRDRDSDRGGVRSSLPVLILNGAADPIGGHDGGRALAAHYRDLGLTDVTFESYPGARHELFNETNRDEVTAATIAWLDAHTSPPT